jgi:AraC-like DNA-binding protein
MRDLPKELREMHLIGEDTPEKVISPKVSPLMTTLHIGLAGVTDAGRGFSMVRHNPAYGHVLACFNGSGEVMIDGEWHACGPGHAYMSPPNGPHAYRTVGKQRWEFAWVWWHPSVTGEPPLIDLSEPVLVRADPEYLRLAILGLYRESIGPAQPTVLDHWVELVHAYAGRLGRSARRGRGHRNLLSLWERVDMNLAHPWTLAQLADAAAMSAEHLRRLTRRQTGRGPMHQVAFLRMRRASTLLESTRQKINSIARTVGYENAFAFSTAFKRHIGTSPADYRQRRVRERRNAKAAVRERKVGQSGKIW